MLTNNTHFEYAAAPCIGDFAKATACSDNVYKGSTGKVFFTMKGANYVCSGSVGSNNLVWTAGHCVFDQTDKFATSWTFVPHYCNGAGTQFSATSLLTNSGWQSGDFSYDYSIAKFAGSPFSVFPKLAVNVVSNPLTTSYQSVGYPAGSPFDGKYINTCYSIGCSRDPASKKPQTIAISCDSTGGSSGGPWVVNGGIASVNSYGYQGVKNTMYGPYFDASAVTLFNSAQN